MSKFNKDLEDGQLQENRVARFHTHHGYKYEPPPSGKFKDHDGIVTHPDGESWAIECKHDLYLEAGKSNNHAIELECNGVPSGISHTKAEVWYVIVNDNAYAFRVDRLKKFISHSKPRVVMGGDNGSAKMALCNWDSLRLNVSHWILDLEKFTATLSTSSNGLINELCFVRI